MTAVTAACLDRIHMLTLAGQIFLGLAILAALLAIVKTAMEQFGARVKKDAVPVPGVDVIKAITELIKALASAPAWIGMAFIGFGLMWYASTLDDGHCGHAPAPAGMVSPTPLVTETGSAPAAVPTTE
ncbi:MAG TPA: hypothetical protein VHG29_13560 [Novosphingobium sp.]|nr:hypothetical protein [Novosphingobium sp.]